MTVFRGASLEPGPSGPELSAHPTSIAGPRFFSMKSFSAGFSYKFLLNVVDWRRVLVVPRVRIISFYQHLSDFDRGRIVAHQDCGLLCRNFSACIVLDLLSYYRIWNWHDKEGYTECCSWRQQIVNRRDGRHLNSMNCINRTTTSQALSQEMGSVVRQVSKRTVWRYLQ